MLRVSRKARRQLKAFTEGTLKDLDMVIAVDEDINIQDPNDVEYALAMRPLHRLIHPGMQAEIIGVEDQANAHSLTTAAPARRASIAQAAALRSRRKRKNSTPSRSLRTSICRSRTISPQIEAIFGARK